MEKPARTARLNVGHYVGLQVLAIFAPPVLFRLYCLPGRPRWRDFNINLALLLLGWIPAAVHASLFLHDLYLAGQGRDVKCFGACISTAPSANAKSYTKAKELAEARPSPEAGDVRRSPGLDAYASSLEVNHISRSTVHSRRTGSSNGSEETLQANSTISSLPDAGHSRQLAVPHQRESGSLFNSSDSNAHMDSKRSFQQSVQSSIQSFLSIFSHVSVEPIYQEHRRKCSRCTHCSRCFEDYVRHHKESEDSMTTPLFSCKNIETHRRHLVTQHHVPGCVCEACTGSAAVPPDLGDHVKGCKCIECRRSKERPPRHMVDRNKVVMGPVGAVVGGGPAFHGY